MHGGPKERCQLHELQYHGGDRQADRQLADPRGRIMTLCAPRLEPLHRTDGRAHTTSVCITDGRNTATRRIHYTHTTHTIMTQDGRAADAIQMQDRHMNGASRTRDGRRTDASSTDPRSAVDMRWCVRAGLTALWALSCVGDI